MPEDAPPTPPPRPQVIIQSIPQTPQIPQAPIAAPQAQPAIPPAPTVVTVTPLPQPAVAAPLPPPTPTPIPVAPKIVPIQKPEDFEYMPKNMRKLPKQRDGQDLYTFLAEDGRWYDLTSKQKLFVECYMKFQCNRITALVEAGYDVYKKDKNGESTGQINFNVAHVMASENLRKPEIIAYLNLSMADFGFNDENVQKQHLFLVNQGDNLPAKAKGIDMWYKLKGEYAPEKHEVFLSEFDKMSNDELLKAAGVASAPAGVNPPASPQTPSVQK
jgi:hypothetical protein